MHVAEICAETKEELAQILQEYLFCIRVANRKLINEVWFGY
jgi:hypothetical protein